MSFLQIYLLLKNGFTNVLCFPFFYYVHVVYAFVLQLGNGILCMLGKY